MLCKLNEHPNKKKNAKNMKSEIILLLLYNEMIKPRKGENMNVVKLINAFTFNVLLFLLFVYMLIRHHKDLQLYS